MISLLLGHGKTPGWFALAGLPLVYIGAYMALDQFVISEVEVRLGSIATLSKEYAHIDLTLNDRSCIAALFASVLMQLGTFYVYLIFSCLAGGINNETPRSERPTSGFLGRLFSAHQNQIESLSGFAAAIFAVIFTSPSSGIFTSSTASAGRVAAIAWTHVLSRSVYWLMYALNLPSLRTFSYVMSVICIIMLFLHALQH